MSLAALKKSRGSSIDKLVQASAKLNEGGNANTGPDERFWKPQRDKAGNGYHVIRFLPQIEGEELPWVRYWDHGFQSPKTGMWYIEKSLTSIGQKDPLGELNSQLWNSGGEGSPGRAQARNQRRRLHYISNIYVIKDSINPENEGKVFLYEYGKKIFDKLMEAMQPKFEDEAPINPFDMWDGADFKMKIATIDAGDGKRMPNYDRSEFAEPSTLGDEDMLETVYNKLYKLSEFTDPANFKSYEELKNRLDTVLGLNNAFTPQQQQDLSVTAESAPIKEVAAAEIPSASSEDDDLTDVDAMFSRLAAED